MSLMVVTFQIPITEDKTVGSGAKHSAFRWRALQNALYERFGGWTRLSGETTGVWKDSKTGKPVRDRCRVFQVDLERDHIEELREILRRACLTFVQQVIRAIVDGRPEYLGASPSHEPL
jgi:hypothetical protein